MRSTHRCEECRAVLDPTKVLRCTKCKACRYCSRECQARNWKRIHKRVCTTDPLLRRFVPVEMAVERALKIQPKIKAPKDATCYICLEGDGKSSKLMRGCACRGDSAGFVHLECLTELAKSKEASADPRTLFDVWMFCGNCKQSFTGALQLETTRRFWRHHRSSQDQDLDYNSTKRLATLLNLNGEVDATNQLLDEASTYVGNEKVMLLDLKLLRADMLLDRGQHLEALGLLQAMMPEAKEFSTGNPGLYARVMGNIAELSLALDRHQEAHEMAIELVAFAKAKLGLEDRRTLGAVGAYAITCAYLGRVEEAKANFEDVLTSQTRVLGRDHPDTQRTRNVMVRFSGALV